MESLSESADASGPEFCPPCVLDKVKKGGPGSECSEWTWGPCAPSSKDCGAGFREGTCGGQTQRLRCRVPCNWKKEFGGEVGAGREQGRGRSLTGTWAGQWGEALGRPALTPALSRQPTASTSLRAGVRAMGALAPKPAKAP